MIRIRNFKKEFKVQVDLEEIIRCQHWKVNEIINQILKNEETF